VDRKKIKKFSSTIYEIICKCELKDKYIYNLFYWIVIIKFLYFNPKYIHNILSKEESLLLHNIVEKHDEKSLVKISHILHDKYDEYFAEPLEDYYIHNIPMKNLINIDYINLNDWNNPEILGWIYQYFIRLFHNSVYSKTQIFTPGWLVKYMVDNTLGRILKKQNIHMEFKYYIPSDEKLDYDYKIENLKILDPACGTGHILSYAFELLYEFYSKLAYDKEKIMRLICENLYGLDIDPKVTNMAKLILMFKSLRVDEKFFTYKLNFKVENFICGNIQKNIPNNIIYDFYNEIQYGSLIKSKKITNIHRKNNGKINRLYDMINDKYDLVITNPPYLSTRAMPENMKNYLRKNYYGYHKDLFAAFILRCMEYGKKDGYIGLMTPFVWMFINSYENLRENIIKNKTILSLIQLQYSGFQDATVPLCSFVLKNKKEGINSTFINLSNFKGEESEDLNLIRSINEKVDYKYIMDQREFLKIPKKNIAYWVEGKMIQAFEKGEELGNMADCRVGLQTSDNNRFVRFWYEVDINQVALNIRSRREAMECEKKWFPYNKGGNFRKWYGNLLHVVDWYNDGENIRAYNNYLNKNRKSNIGIANTQYYFNKGITWSFVSSSYFGARIHPSGFIFDTAGSCIFLDENLINYMTGFLCSKVCDKIMKIINPTLNFQPKDMGKIPILIRDKEMVDILSKRAIDICKRDWEEKEIFWNFKYHPLLQFSEERLENICDNYLIQRYKEMEKLVKIEEKINKIFIKNYGLDLDYRVRKEDITLTGINKEDLIKSLISYFVGCIMGRYDVKKEGVVFAGGNFNRNIYEFKPSEFEIIESHVLYKELINIIKFVFKEKYFHENIKFIGDLLGKGKDPINNIKKYIMNGFYKDHVKKYKRRPIYFKLSSGKKRSFEGYLYIHRYKEDTFKKLIKEMKNNLKYKDEEEKNELISYIKNVEHMRDLKIHLDDGVRNNYKLMGKILKKI
jgi:SAM-dependent methyltransferase